MTKITRNYLWGCNPKYLENNYNDHHNQAALKSAIYGILANNAYPPSTRPQFKLPENWRPIDFEFDDPLDSGLDFTLFARSVGGETREVVIAYRGIDGAQDWKDGNTFQTQYDSADILVPQVMQHFQGCKIVCSGHSLGGGLALHTSLITPEIDAFAFNPSFRLQSNGRAENNLRYCLHEKGDILSFHRFIWKNPSDTLVFGDFNFSYKKNHTSYPLTRGLLMLAALQSREYAELLVQNCELTAEEYELIEMPETTWAGKGYAVLPPEPI